MKTFIRWIVVVIVLGVISPLGAEAKLQKQVSRKSSKDALFELKQGLDRIISQVEPFVHIGVEIVSLENGQTIYEKNAHQLFTPASSQKVYTAAAALALLGPDFRFETSFLSEGQINQGVLKGNLYLKGSGNPEFSLKDLEELIFQLKIMQIKEIQGDLIIDNFAFDGISRGPGWMWDEKPAFWNSPMDALLINHSCVKLWVHPSTANQPPHVLCFPKTEFVSIQNEAVTLPLAEKKLDVVRNQNNQFEIKGEISLENGAQEIEIPLDQPHLYVAHLLLELLPKYGIKFSGKLKHQPTPQTALCLATHFSSPLPLLIRQMMKVSDNLYSSCLFKKMGQIKSGKIGSWKTGAIALKGFLEERIKINPMDLAILDGSGESRYNLTSPHQFVTVLAAMYEQKESFPEFFASFPISGVDGCLEYRLNDSETKGKIRAKTGTMTGVSSLSGYATTKRGGLLAFSILLNGFTQPADYYKTQIEDEICSLLVRSVHDNF